MNPLFKISFSVFSLFLLCSFSVTSFAQNSGAIAVDKNQHPGVFITINKNYNNADIDGYNLYVPRSCNEKSAEFPVIIFLQGGLGVGGEVEVIYNWALPKLLVDTKDLSTEYNRLLLNTFVIIMPHIRDGNFFDNEKVIKEILAEVGSEFPIDEKRIYLTGLSRGGYGTWGLASRMPEVFAAIAPVCGGSSGIVDYAPLAKTPIWLAHNPDDGIINYESSIRILDKIKKVSGVEFYHSSSVAAADYQTHAHIFTSSQSPNDNDHDAWTELYGNANFYRWLLLHSKE